VPGRRAFRTGPLWSRFGKTKFGYWPKGEAESSSQGRAPESEASESNVNAQKNQTNTDSITLAKEEGLGARTKLNWAYLQGALVVAGIAGGAFGSWWVFVITAGVLIAGQVAAGEIRWKKRE
jgi:hypothetical protein